MALFCEMKIDWLYVLLAFPHFSKQQVRFGTIIELYDMNIALLSNESFALWDRTTLFDIFQFLYNLCDFKINFTALTSQPLFPFALIIPISSILHWCFFPLRPNIKIFWGSPAELHPFQRVETTGVEPQFHHQRAAESTKRDVQRSWSGCGISCELWPSGGCSTGRREEFGQFPAQFLTIELCCCCR